MTKQNTLTYSTQVRVQYILLVHVLHKNIVKQIWGEAACASESEDDRAEQQSIEREKKQSATQLYLLLKPSTNSQRGGEVEENLG